jgi:RNA polymerase sigma-70 factor (ECF subfamily)
MSDMIELAEVNPGDPVALARDGDAIAFGLVMRPLVESGLRLAVGMLGDRALAEDAVQDAMVLAWRRISGLRDAAALRLWFLAIVANRCRDARRARWWSVLKRAELRAAAWDTSDRGALLDLRAALARLGVEQRLVIVLHYYFDLSLDDVAEVAGVRLGTVKSRLHRGLQELRSSMAATEDRR